MNGYLLVIHGPKEEDEYHGTLRYANNKFDTDLIHRTPPALTGTPEHLDSGFQDYGMEISLTELLDRFPPKRLNIDLDYEFLSDEELLDLACQHFFLTPIGCFRLKISDKKIIFANDKDRRAVEKEDEDTKRKKSCCSAVSRVALKLSGLFPCLSSKSNVSQTADKQSPASSPTAGSENDPDHPDSLRKRAPSIT
jgi:hypothetical protein